MSVFAIGDLHLPGRDDKPMDVFGSQWDRHFDLIRQNWQSAVSDGDIVLIPGDISWAMQIENAMDDLRDISELPGQKLLLRGNHDYWWSTITKVRSALFERMYALQNDAIVLNGMVFCGTRGWTLPTQAQPLQPQDERIFNREQLRLRLSLEAARRLGDDITVMMHYPPLYADGEDTAFTDILSEYPVRRLVYGHLHGSGIKIAYNGEKNGIDYRLVSCDALDFAPLKLDDINNIKQI